MTNQFEIPATTEDFAVVADIGLGMTAAQAALGEKPGAFALRLPDGYRDEIKRTAKANGRSMNAEIIFRLEVSFKLEEMRAEIIREAFAGKRETMLAEAVAWVEQNGQWRGATSKGDA